MGKIGLLVIAAATLAAGLSGCATSTTTSKAGASSTPASSPTTASASPTGSSGSTTPTTTTTPSRSPAAAPAPKASTPATKQVLLSIKNFKYLVPASVRPGAKITVKNEDAENHTVTSATPGAFDVTATAGGKTVTFTAPTKPGRYPFTCTFHSNMTGTLVVK